MGLASDGEYRWIGIGGIAAIFGALSWLFFLGEPQEPQQAMRAEFGVASEPNR